LSAQDVFEVYDSIRRRNEAEAQRRRREVYGKVPELKGLHERIRALQLERIRAAVQGGQFSTDTIAELRRNAAQLLADAGYDAHYLDPIYTCPVCRDTGLRDDAHRCGCFIRYQLESKLDEARLGDDGVSFDRYDVTRFSDEPLENGRSQRDYMVQYKRITSDWADSFPSCSQILLLAGSAGLGKTYTARCVMRRVIERGYTAAYYTAYRLFSIFHSHRLGDSVDLSPLFSVPLLIIDDLGTEPMTRNVTVEYLFDLINERITTGLHTIIATNLAFHEIKAVYGDRIHSRLMDARHAEKLIFHGRDIRY
jgi:DNA replication protein DnaC